MRCGWPSPASQAPVEQTEARDRRQARIPSFLVESVAFARAPARLLRYVRDQRFHPGIAPTEGEEADMTNQHRNYIQALVASLLPVAAWAGPVNVNSADAATLARELDGIGPVKAQAIVDYRQKNGPFRSADDLLRVDGIGERVLEQNRGNIRIEKSTTSAASTPKPATRI
jgi:competence protein ComEA